MHVFWLKSVTIILGLGFFIASWITIEKHPEPQKFSSPTPFNTSQTPFYSEQFIPKHQTVMVHAAQAHSNPQGITAYWFAGSREGASDVEIYSASYTNQQWGIPRAVTNRKQVARDLNRYIRKLGNPVSYRFENGKIWLFFVSVSVGGWGGSSINMIESNDEGRTWSRAKQLVTSPFFNISTLVRNKPVQYQDGTIGLPIYHEFLRKFGEIIRLDESGEIIGKIRLSHGTSTLQPTIVAESESDAVVLLRNAGDKPRQILRLKTSDSGYSWSKAEALDLPNPDAAIDALSFQNRTLLVFNNTVRGRNDLSLAISTNKEWHILRRFDHSETSNTSEFSYPAVIRGFDDNIHVLYTWNRELIKHISFNANWIEEQL